MARIRPKKREPAARKKAAVSSSGQAAKKIRRPRRPLELWEKKQLEIVNRLRHRLEEWLPDWQPVWVRLADDGIHSIERTGDEPWRFRLPDVPAEWRPLFVGLLDLLDEQSAVARVAVTVAKSQIEYLKAAGVDGGYGGRPTERPSDEELKQLYDRFEKEAWTSDSNRDWEVAARSGLVKYLVATYDIDESTARKWLKNAGI